MTIQYDRALDIALGNSRKTKTWKNRPVKWSELLDRFASTTRTSETVAEYKAMSKAEQDEKKNVGGFVGGYCQDGSRSRVTHRSVLCLDADFADTELWPDWKLLYGRAAACYSTHKHTPDTPRLRLVIPLARDVTPDEYGAIGRRVAAALGINKFDDSTYEPSRLMFWPSTSQDGAYFFDHVDAAFLDPDEVLATYYDWRDISSWPTSDRVASIAKRAAAKQQDPHEKGGIVGAFCRAYTVQEAIAAYVPAYEPCDVPGRYTYTEGSTAAGIVIYEDKFAYSHHATDPASGQLCNAWDVVRLHRFAELDERTDADTAPSKRPSYKAMAELASQDKRVTAQIVADRMAEAGADFDAPVESGNWRELLKTSDKGVILSSIENVVTILTHDPTLAGKLAVNEMEHNIVVTSSLPWREIEKPAQWLDRDDAELRYYLERTFGIVGKDRIYDAVNVAAQANAFHPVREYLEGCEWDGVSRVDTLLIDYLGAEDTPYTRAVTRKTLVAAVARIFEPGCKFDNMLTLRGAQGTGKSTLISRLGGPWFSDTFSTIQGKEAYEQIIGAWIIEVGELEGMRKAEATTIKFYISKQCDRFRPAYDRRTQEFPRQCIFIASTNETQFLRDTTGNRRFWVVDTPDAPTRDVWDDLTEDEVRHIWAEAVTFYRAGEELYLPREIEAMAREVQETYEEENPRAGLVAEYLARKLPAGWDSLDLYARRQWLETDAEGTVERESACTIEIYAEALGGNPDRFDRYAGKEIRDIMERLPDWRYQGNRLLTIRPYGRQRYFRKVTK